MHAARLAVVGDERFFCELLGRVLSADHAVVVATGETAALRLGLFETPVDAVIVDDRMKHALEMCAAMARAKGPPVLFVAVPGDAAAARALAAGARGIVYASSALDDVLRAIAVVRQGQLWAPRHVVASALTDRQQDRAAHARVTRQGPALDQCLSPREREVLRYAATGCANKDVATRLSISEATVKVHLTHIFRKLGLRTRTELAAAYHGVLTAGAHGEPRSAAEQ